MNMVVCHHHHPKDIREGTTTDRYLAPAISKFAITVQKEEERELTLDPGESELRREIVNLHQNGARSESLKKTMTPGSELERSLSKHKDSQGRLGEKPNVGKGFNN